VTAGLTPEEIAELEQLAEQSIDLEPGAARRKLEELTPAQKIVLLTAASDALGGAPEEYGDNYLLGIKNIQAETLAYDQRVRAEADGVSARLDGEDQSAARLGCRPGVRGLAGGGQREVRRRADLPQQRRHPVGPAPAGVRARLHGRLVHREGP
jgi:hypothetical protein